jgi:hypothetical protein
VVESPIGPEVGCDAGPSRCPHKIREVTRFTAGRIASSALEVVAELRGPWARSSTKRDGRPSKTPRQALTWRGAEMRGETEDDYSSSSGAP